jgi:hypothetical protein
MGSDSNMTRVQLLPDMSTLISNSILINRMYKKGHQHPASLWRAMPDKYGFGKTQLNGKTTG